MAYGINFDANDVDPNGGFEPIPAGEYEVIMIKDERKEGKEEKAGQFYVSLHYKIVSGKYEGRILFDQLYLEYKKPEAVKMAREKLSRICRATGIMKVKDDLLELYNTPMIVKVILKKYQGEDQNEIKTYIKKPSSLINQNSQTQQVETTRVEGDNGQGGDKKPWQK